MQVAIISVNPNFEICSHDIKSKIEIRVAELIAGKIDYNWI